MRAIDKDMIINIIKGAFSCFNTAHPELAIPEDLWGRIAVRAAGVLLYVIRMRCAKLADLIVVSESKQGSAPKKSEEAA